VCGERQESRSSPATRTEYATGRSCHRSASATVRRTNLAGRVCPTEASGRPEDGLGLKGMVLWTGASNSAWCHEHAPRNPGRICALLEIEPADVTSD
jgi:hypothetical protein